MGRAPPNPANEGNKVTADLAAKSPEALQLSNPANEVTADSQQESAQSEKSLAAPFRDFIEEQLTRGRNAVLMEEPTPVIGLFAKCAREGGPPR
jgi:uncharacterized protein involved in exopolysaccharide biosynthesis